MIYVEVNMKENTYETYVKKKSRNLIWCARHVS